MISRLLISLSLLLLAWQNVEAQLAPPEQFFNSGAQFYISNNIPAALERVEMGLKTYPDDEKLKKLEQLLKQQQQQNQQQQNQQQQQDKSDDQKNQQSEPKKDSQQKPEEKKPEQADQKKDEEQKPLEPKKEPGEQPKDEKQDQDSQQGQPVKPGEMTPEEAKSLLDAQKGNEQLLQFKPDDKPRNPNRPVKDW